MASFLDEIRMSTVTTDSGCWEWQRARSAYGYGQKGEGGKVVYVHRLVAEHVYGPPPMGHEVLHSCDNPPCCNPDHLRWGTRRENIAEARSRGRWVPFTGFHGEAHPMHVLTAADVREIRRRHDEGMSARELAASYGVTRNHIGSICARRAWKTVA